MPRPFRRAATIAGHLAVWPALYTAGCVAAFAHLTGHREGWWATLAAFLGAGGCFLLDRVKLAPALHDPGDAIAQPLRFSYLRRHDRVARLGALLALAAGVALAMGIGRERLALAIAILTMLTIAYAPQAGGRILRIKNLLGVKNIATGAGLALFAALATGPMRVWPAVVVALIVCADSILCDLEDSDADRRTGVASLPARWGHPAAYAIALALQMAAGGLALALPILSDTATASPERVVVFFVLLLASSLLIPLSHLDTRDTIDLRLLPLALLLM